MSLAVDTNLLLYASDQASPFHARARQLLNELAAGSTLLYLFWPIALGYLRIATHPRIFANPLSAEEAHRNIGALVDLPHVRTPGEGRRFWDNFCAVSAETPLSGNLVPDGHVVALMREHGVRRIWTSDRDFRKFDDIEAIDPFI